MEAANNSIVFSCVCVLGGRVHTRCEGLLVKLVLDARSFRRHEFGTSQVIC